MPVYRALLYLYPASFRSEYGGEMCAVFARRRRDTPGWLLLVLWVQVLFETLANAVAVHGDILRQDVRYTVRSLARTPGFALTAIVVVALGVGANTAAFSVTDRVLVRPLPFPDSDRLVKVWERHQGYARMELSPANYRDWKQASRSFEAMGAFFPSSVNLTGAGEPKRIEGTNVTAGLLPVLGARPLFGRLFTEADDREGAAGTVLLSYRLWQAVFAGDAGVLGRRMLLDNTPYTVIGVMPDDFSFPSREGEFWVPMRFEAQQFVDRNDNYLQAVAKLKPGVTMANALADLTLVEAQLARQYPRENKDTGVTVNRMRDEISQQSRMLLLGLSGAALCVLLIACTNLANLLLARALARQRELAVRTAMGAGRERLTRQLLTESLMLAVAGGLVGLLVGDAALPLLARLAPNSLPLSQAPTIDLRVLIFAALLTVLTGVGFGVIPAWRICRQSDLTGLREGARSGGGRKERLRSALVVAEVAASMVLLISAGLLVRALWRIQATDPGFRTDHVTTLRTALPFPKYEMTVRRKAFYSRVLSGVRGLPGVTNAAYISFLPMTLGGGIWPVVLDGQVHDRSESNVASLRYVTPGFFASLRIPVHAGRDVSESDTAEMPFGAVVSESMVRRYWPNGSPLGRHFQFALHDRVVIGVVGDIRVRGPEQPSEPQVYVPYLQVPDGALEFYAPQDLVIQSRTDPAALVPLVRAIIRSADPDQPISEVRSMADIVERQTGPRTVQVRVLVAFALVAILLAGIGIHGVLSFMVTQRAREIAVRVALGAQPSDIILKVLKQGFWLALAGGVPGAVLAYGSGQIMRSLLAGVDPLDAATFLIAGGVCFSMTVAGCLLPAVRAVRLDPIEAIRAE